MTATVAPCTGDPDLYIWAGGSHGEPDYYSANGGIAVDEVSFMAPASGVYRLFVYGYEESTFTLTLARSAAEPGALLQASKTRILGADKSLPAAPPSEVEQPPTYAPTEAPAGALSYKVYLPSVLRSYGQ